MRRLGFVGYATLRTGRVHLFCPKCHRKLSNMPRDDFDPPKTALVHVRCERCSAGDKASEQRFLSARGEELCSYCGTASCERVGGHDECDERLIRTPKRAESEESKPDAD